MEEQAVSTKTLNELQSTYENLKKQTQINDVRQQLAEHIRALLRAHEVNNQSIADMAMRLSELSMSQEETFKALNEKVKEAKEISGEFRPVVESINDIADQTNLLALNAAIEGSPRRRLRQRLRGQEPRQVAQNGRENYNSSRQNYSLCDNACKDICKD